MRYFVLACLFAFLLPGLAAAGAPQLSGPESHRAAARKVHLVVEQVFAEITRRAEAGEAMTEGTLRDFVEESLRAQDLVFDARPIVAVNVGASDPAYTGSPVVAVKRGDLLLLEIRARLPEAGAVSAQVTWVAFLGSRFDLPPRMARVWPIVKASRDAAVAELRGAARKGVPPVKEEMEAAAAKVARRGKHQTSFRIQTTPVANGCWVVAPAIYYSAEFGVRSGVGVCVAGKNVEPSSVAQQEIRFLLK